MRLRPFLALALLFAAAIPAFAGTDDGKSTVNVTLAQDPFAKGDTEFELLGSYFHSPITTGGGKRPEFDYSGGDIRWGIVLTPTLCDSCPLLRGDLEFLVDGFGEGVTEGPGNYLVGGDAMFRYNFFHPGSKLIPYFQVSGGGLHSDATEDPSQRIIGGAFEFVLEADLGIRYLINDKWSILAEGGFQHISNADTASRNVGVNALSSRIGLGFKY